MEATDEIMNITTERYRLLMEEQEQLRAAAKRAIALEREVAMLKKIVPAQYHATMRDMMQRVNRWQGLAQSALGNVARLAKEMQEEVKQL